VKSAPVNEPKNSAVCGANVVISAPQASGTTIIPPGTFSIARLILMSVPLPAHRHAVRKHASDEV
jgi:hypothetical protein